MKGIFFNVFFIFLQSSLIADDGYKRNLQLDVINYSFGISISDSSNMIYGETKILLRLKEGISNMEFDLKNIKPDGKGMVVDSVLFNACNIKWKHNGNKILISPLKELDGTTETTLKICYHGIPSKGLIISANKYGMRSFFSDHWPDRASDYLPCLDHPYDKASVDFIIRAPSHYEIVANGYLVEESHLKGDVKLTHWKEDVPIATKVMAFGAADFDFRLEGFSNNIPVWTYVFKENSKEGFHDYSVALKPIEFFSGLIGEYSYEKLANVQSETTYGGLENAGCIFYYENSVTGNGTAESLIAHEIAHQWFGNSVTENDWHHIWLSEGFATYLTSVYLEKNYGKERFAHEMSADRDEVIKYFLKSPSAVIDTAITGRMKLLNTNSYQKGAWVLHMLRNELGDEVFWKGMRSFYSKFRNKNAMTSDFETTMEEVSGKDLEYFFHQWLYVAGQPDLRITYRFIKGEGVTEITVDQTQKQLFRFPLVLLINSQSEISREKIQISERITSIKINRSDVLDIIPDPEINLLFREVN